jgi:hypothetical protein
MPQSSIDWLKTNFFKTELELGPCLRLPREGPCECDLYLSCAKFVTTPEYAPRLRRRRKQESDLMEDAQQRGWIKEVERHRCTMNRIEQLLKELGEPLEGQEAIYLVFRVLQLGRSCGFLIKLTLPARRIGQRWRPT